MYFYGEAVYDGKPCDATGIGKNFVLKGKNTLYLFFFDLAECGDGDVTMNGIMYSGGYAFGNVSDKIKEIEWMDTHEKLEFFQNGNILSVNVTEYPYGMSTCVRVAKALIAEKNEV